MAKEIRGRSGAGNAPAHGLAPQNLSPDKRVDVCADSDEDRGSTPLASTMLIFSELHCNIGASRNFSRNISTEVHFQGFALSARIRSPLLPRDKRSWVYAKFRSRSHDAVIRVYDGAGNLIETNEHAGEFK